MKALLLAGACIGGTCAADPAAELAQLQELGRGVAAARCARPQEAKTVALGGDELRSVDCRSFRVAYEVRRRGGGEHEVPVALTVSGAPPVLPEGLRPGSTPAEVQARLGTPTLQVGRNFGYAIGRDSVMFELADDGRVNAVSWSWSTP